MGQSRLDGLESVTRILCGYKMAAGLKGFFYKVAIGPAILYGCWVVRMACS